MRSARWLYTLLAISILCLPVGGWAATYKVDVDHTTVGFQVRHLFTKVSGRFDRFEGQIVFDPEEPGKVAVKGTIDAGSINTNVAKRDEHLRSKDFFDVEKFPKIAFVSTRATEVDASANSGKLQGELTIHGVTRPIVLDVAFLGEGKDPWGNRRAGFTAKATIDRKDFGLTWNKTLETGGLLVGDEVLIEIEVEGIVVE